MAGESKLKATVYRKNGKQRVFIDQGEHVAVCSGDGKSARYSKMTWRAAVAYEQRLIRDGWESVK
jgi:hypothetical protein